MEDVSVLTVHFYAWGDEEISTKHAKILEVAGQLQPFFESNRKMNLFFRAVRQDRAALIDLKGRLERLNVGDHGTSFHLEFRLKPARTEVPRVLDMLNRDYLDELVETLAVTSTRGVSLLRGLVVKKSENHHDPMRIYIGQIVQIPLEVVQALPGMGPHYLDELKSGLAKRGLSFGMEIGEEDWAPKLVVQFPVPSMDVLMRRVDTLELSTRSRNALASDRIVLIGDLVMKTKAEMLRTPDFGRVSLKEVEDRLAEIQCQFGTDLPDWPPDA